MQLTILQNHSRKKEWCKAENGFIITLHFGEKDKSGNLENPVGTSVKLQNYSLMVGEIIKEFYISAIVGSIMANKVAVFIPWASSNIGFEERAQIIERSRNMVHKLGRQTNLYFQAGIGIHRDIHRRSWR
ncbi:MAG: hypothetical protein ACERKZ_13405 [Lachnotalea sp.]